jgi:Tfp pilus assembly protein PilO
VNRAKVMIPALLGVAAIAAFYFLVLAPKREEITRLDTEIVAAESTAQQAEAQAASYAKAKDSYQANYKTIVGLGKAVPADDDVRSLLVQLDDAAARSKVDFRSMSLTPGGASPGAAGGTSAPSAGELAPAPGSVPVGSAGFAAMPFSFSFDGSFFRLSEFFDRVDRFVEVENEAIDVTGRLMLIGSISLTPQTGDDLSTLNAQIGAATYLVPSQDGLTGGATPQAPAGAAPAATPSADGDSAVPTNPTATITGAP